MCWLGVLIYSVCWWPSVGRLDSVSWRVDYTLSSSDLREVNAPLIQLKLQTQDTEPGSSETTVVSISADKFRVLLTGQLILCTSCELTLIFSPYFPLQKKQTKQKIVQLEYCCGNCLFVVVVVFQQSSNKPRLWWMHYNEDWKTNIWWWTGQNWCW